MPYYDYICQDCKNTFEIFCDYKMSVLYDPKCPKCNSADVKKKISVPTIVFKGKGFYKTDNGETD